IEIRVEDSNSKHRFLVLPVRPAGTEGWSEEQLAAIVTRDCMIGVALPKPGVTTNVVRAVHRATQPVTGHFTGKGTGMAPTQDVTTVRVKSLEQLVERGMVWSRMAEKYGVTNPVPPWKSSLDGMCDALDECSTVLPLLTRREDEDRLSEHQYSELPFPES